ncbi:MAG: hypothetical protein MPJ50_00160 [Pirellulales bacterium]|nr:hypothetical protein [Pirellulales bacterium]
MRFLSARVLGFAFISGLTACAMFWPGSLSGSPQGMQQSPPGQNRGRYNPNYREGKSVEGLRGSIRVVQSRYVLFPEEGAFRFVLLENLNLERIARAMAETTGDVRWEIDAEVTEFGGASYLLVQRAQLIGG